MTWLYKQRRYGIVQKLTLFVENFLSISSQTDHIPLLVSSCPSSVEGEPISVASHSIASLAHDSLLCRYCRYDQTLWMTLASFP